MTSKKKEPALGRGLEALMGGGAWDKPMDNQNKTVSQAVHMPFVVEESVIGGIAAIPIHLIEPNPNQPRREFNEESLEELCQSIRANGIIQPLTVRKTGKKYELISGERRLRAAKKAGLDEVPAYIRMVTDAQSFEMAITENIQRENLNALDVALSYQALMDRCQYNQETLAKQLGKGRSTVANFLRLLKLPAQIQLNIRDNKLSMGHARCLVGVESDTRQLELAATVIEKDLSVRQLEDLIRQTDTSAQDMPEDRPETKKHTPRKTEDLPSWCLDGRNRLAEKLQTPITVKPGKEGKGQLIISYASQEVLQKIFNALNE